MDRKGQVHSPVVVVTGVRAAPPDDGPLQLGAGICAHLKKPSFGSCRKMCNVEECRTRLVAMAEQTAMQSAAATARTASITIRETMPEACSIQIRISGP